MPCGEATIPYVLREKVVAVMQNGSAEICGECRETFTDGAVDGHVTSLLRQLDNVPGEASVVSYSEYGRARRMSCWQREVDALPDEMTIGLSKSRLAFFKEAAAEYNTSCQKMIRRLLGGYEERRKARRISAESG